MGDCHSCGIELLKVCQKKLFINKKKQWWSIGHEVVGTTFEGRDKKVNKVMYNDTTPLELIGYLKPYLSEFLVHNFIFHWQETTDYDPMIKNSKILKEVQYYVLDGKDRETLFV